jgi:hypothetical protein
MDIITKLPINTATRNYYHPLSGLSEICLTWNPAFCPTTHEGWEFQPSPFFSEVKGAVHLFIADHDHGIVRGQWFFIEIFRKPVIPVGEPGPAIEISFGP